MVTPGLKPRRSRRSLTPGARSLTEKRRPGGPRYRVGCLRNYAALCFSLPVIGRSLTAPKTFAYSVVSY